MSTATTNPAAHGPLLEPYSGHSLTYQDILLCGANVAGFARDVADLSIGGAVTLELLELHSNALENDDGRPLLSPFQAVTLLRAQIVQQRMLTRRAEEFLSWVEERGSVQGGTRHG
jgi:hypothetical protein